MEDKKYSLGGFTFDTQQEYERAKVELQVILKIKQKLDIENPIIRINTAFKGCSSLEKISVLPRIYHN